MRQDVSAQIHNMDKSVEPHSHLICEFRCLKSSTQSVFINICELISCYKELAELSSLKDILQLSVSVVIAKQQSPRTTATRPQVQTRIICKSFINISTKNVCRELRYMSFPVCVAPFMCPSTFVHINVSSGYTGSSVQAK